MMDRYYNIFDDDRIPESWVLTVRKCECGQTLYYDRKKKTWHCMKASCPLYKSHVKKKQIPQEKLDRILELGEVLTIKEIAGRLKLSEKDVFRVLREHDIM
ncbi:MAG: hypothetical protein EOM68_25320 [Spirochaetia bacterium]|nr:hypothetical protein [Spirochaetia bacterium]